MSDDESSVLRLSDKHLERRLLIYSKVAKYPWKPEGQSFAILLVTTNVFEAWTKLLFLKFHENGKADDVECWTMDSHNYKNGSR